MRFFRRIEYHNYAGMLIDKKIAKIIKKNTKVIILKNHVSIIFTDTIEELFHLTFHFEKYCNIQLSIKNQNKINN